MTAESVATSSAPRPVVTERLRPFARTAFYAVRGSRARVRARVRPTRAQAGSGLIFIIGCGRSGTTLLGELLSLHRDVKYFYEPYDLWAAIEPATDVVGLYSHADAHCLLDAGDVTATTRARFSRLMPASPRLVTVEKSPINALRIGFLDALSPDARYVHIVRDGVDVARSIQRMAAVTRRMAFRPPMNEWWGVGDAKWTALARDGRATGYYPEEVGLLGNDAQRGAYEWLMSVREARAWRVALGSRWVEVRYADLTTDPQVMLRRIATAVGLSCSGQWLDSAAARVRPNTRSDGPPLALPEQMRADFNGLQASFGFMGRAIEPDP
jgi:hypothetical protein